MTREKIRDSLKLAGIRLFLFSIFCLAIPFLLLWCTLVIRFSFPDPIKVLLAWLFPITLISILLFSKNLTRSLQIFASSCAVVFLCYTVIRPKNNRNWMEDVAKIPEISFSDRDITIKNFRHFKYKSSHEFENNYEERKYNLNDLEGTDFILSYWDGHRSIAHTFVSFRFKNQPPICISVEVRKEKGEKYHPVNGLFKQYEIIYVIGDERDMIPLRTHHRGEETFLYKLDIDKKQSEVFLMALLQDASSLKSSPRFYHSLNQNCTTTLVNHINSIPGFKVDITMNMVLNGLSDYAVYLLKGIKNDLPFITVKQCSYITETSLKTPLDENFSQKIRDSIYQKITQELNHSN